jgi:hypothetical protein
VGKLIVDPKALNEIQALARAKAEENRRLALPAPAETASNLNIPRVFE